MDLTRLMHTADFEESSFTYQDIRTWAQDDNGGALPIESARPFAEWLNVTWNDFDDGSGKQTNDDVLKGALSSWTGRS